MISSHPALADTCFARNRSPIVTVNFVLLQPLVALIAGILILIVPRILNLVVALYLILIGLAGLLPHFMR
jgi:hypothetical protein